MVLKGNFMKVTLLALSVLFLLPNFFNVHLEEKPQYDHKELFSPELAYINSTEVLTRVADSIAEKQHIQQGTLQYAKTVSHLIRERFYHGFSQYPLNQNWIAAASQQLFGYGLNCIVLPNDILKYSYGGCSQQSIILREVMKTKNIPYRFVGFPHHYATELLFDKKWYFFDPNMEPRLLSDSDRLESSWNCCAENLKKFYDTSRFHDLDWKFGKNFMVTFGKVNSPAAPNAAIFQTTTKYLSKTLWLFPLLIVFYKKRKSSPNSSAK